MALISCPECAEKISEYAEFCPHCGCPKRYLRSTNKVGLSENNRIKVEDTNKVWDKSIELDWETRQVQAKNNEEYVKKMEFLRRTVVIRAGDDVEVIDAENKKRYVLERISANDQINGMRLGDKFVHNSTVYEISNIKVNKKLHKKQFGEYLRDGKHCDIGLPTPTVKPIEVPARWIL